MKRLRTTKVIIEKSTVCKMVIRAVEKIKARTQDRKYLYEQKWKF